MFSFFTKFFGGSKLSKYQNLVTLLLSNDIKVNHNFLNEIIQKFKVIDYENLFYGNEKYPYPIEEQETFKNLITKFHNYFYIIEEWKDQKNNHKYIQILWVNYPKIKEINQNTPLEETENKIKEIFKDYSLPTDIKNKIIEIITNSPFKEADKIIESLPYSINEIISDLKGLNTKINESIESKSNKSIESKSTQKNSINEKDKKLSKSFYLNLISTFVTLSGDLYDCYQQTHKLNYDDKKADKTKKIISDKLVNNKSNNCKKKFNFDRIKNAYNDIKNGKINKVLIGSFTLLISACNCFKEISNLYDSIKNLEQEKKNYNQYKLHFNLIIQAFDTQKEKFGKISKNRDEAIKDYYEISKEIGNIYNELENLIKLIKNEIKNQKSRKTQSGFGVAFSILGLIVSLSTLIITKDIAFGINCISNGCNLIENSINLNDALNYLEKYEILLKECRKKRDEIQSFIKILLGELNILKYPNQLNSITEKIHSF